MEIKILNKLYMCGIFFCIDNNLNIKKAIESLNILKRRGPDYLHYNIQNNIFLDQTILSIVGKYNKNNFTNNEYTILFNGEIYNYREIENIDSDTKVLVNMFSKYDFNTIIDKLDGMYCFVCYNSNTNKIYVSRDLQGEKGLYYYIDDNKIIFSSEIKPIINYIGKNELNIDILKRYFYTRHLINFKETIYKDIYLLEPGENLVININNKKIINKFHVDIGDFVNIESLKKYKKKSNEQLEIILENSPS